VATSAPWPPGKRFGAEAAAQEIDMAEDRAAHVPEAGDAAASAKTGSPALRWLPVAALLAGAALFFGFGLHENLGFEALREHRMELLSWIEARPALAALLFVGIYAAAIVFLPPSGTVMTVFGGFLFGVYWGTALVVVGATLGATLFFLVARYSIGDLLRRRAGPALRRLEAGFRDDALSYMLTLRLIPVFPFWLVNLAPALLAVPLRTYVVGTAIGIVPATAVYAVFGDGLGAILDRNDEVSLTAVITPEILAGLVGLGLLSLLPVIYKKIKGRPPAGT
jgi:uncharacterized membrane protein YdjX (TVP38/TMEM64 family)